MTNRITEGFDWFPSGKSEAARETLWGANGYYNIVSMGGGLIPDVVTGRFGFGKAISWDYYFVGAIGGASYGKIIPIDATPSTGWVGVAVFRDKTNMPDTAPSIGFFDAVASVFQVSVDFDKFGVIRVYRGKRYGSGVGGVGTLLASSAAGSFEEDQWFHAEIKCVVDNTGGSVQVRINTVIKVDLVSADTQNSANTSFDSIFMGLSTAFIGNDYVRFQFDDFFVNDNAGSTMNDWQGNLRVKTQFMIDNGFTNNFTIGGSAPAATNWQSVLNQNLDDTKYVYSSTIGHIDLYDPDPILNAPYVRVVQVRKALRQDDATQRNAKGMLRIAGVNYENSVNHATNQTYTFYNSRWELNPNTGVSFTGAEVNGLQAGLKVQS